MKNSDLKSSLEQLDIEKYIYENLNKPDITEKVKVTFYEMVATQEK